MRLTAFTGVMAVLLVVAAGAQTPQQYATGTSWEASLAGAPEVSLLGAASLAAYGGNIYVLQGNTLLKLGSDMRQLASVQLPDLSQAMAAVQDTRFEITCGMQGQQTNASFDSNAALNSYGDGWMNTPSNASLQSTTVPASTQQCVNQNMVQGLHQAHVLNSMGQAQLAADQYGVYLLRGGRVTVFDPDLREMRGRDIIEPVSQASQCATCTNMLDNGMVMDQVRFRGMTSGLCPGPGQYQNGWNRTSSGTLVPASYSETPTSVGGATGTTTAPLPAGTGSGPGASVAPTGSSWYPTGTAGSEQFRAAEQVSQLPRPGQVYGTGVATSPGSTGTRMAGTAASSTSVRASQGVAGTVPGSSGTARAGTATSAGSASGVSSGPAVAAPAMGTGFGSKPAATAPTSNNYTVVTNEPGYETETGFAAEVQPPSQDPRNGSYSWMYSLPQLVPGAVYPVAHRLIPGGNVFMGLSGDQQRGPQYLHLHVLQPDGTADPQSQVVSAYLYQRGDVEAGRALSLEKHAPGEYRTLFEPASMHGDTLAVRVSRPGRQEEVVYLPLSHPESDVPR